MKADALTILRRSGSLILTGAAAARRSRALEIRREARAAGLDVRFRSVGRVIELELIQ